jgi:hypothetical protein
MISLQNIIYWFAILILLAVLFQFVFRKYISYDCDVCKARHSKRGRQRKRSEPEPEKDSDSGSDVSDY